MKPGDIVIYDSNFGYDICIYFGDSKNMYDTHLVYMLSGVVTGFNSFNSSYIIPFNLNNYKLMVDKYNVENLHYIDIHKDMINERRDEARLISAVEQYNII